MTLTARAMEATGEVARLHGSFIVTVTAKGEVELSAWSSSGQQVKLVSEGIGVTDQQAHDIEIRLSGGQLSLWVDGNLAADTAFQGTFANFGTHDLVFGNPWSKANFNGDINAFTISMIGDAGLSDASDTLPSPGPDLLRLHDSGVFEVTAENGATLLDPSGTHGAEGLHLGGPGVAAAVARAHVAPLFGAAQASIALSLSADTIGATGEVVRLHDAFVITVVNDGNILVQARSAAGQNIRLTTSGIAVNDMQQHDIVLHLSDGQIELWVDARHLAGSAFDGGFADLGRHDLTFGNPWGKVNFGGDLSAFAIALGGGEPAPGTVGQTYHASSAAFTDGPLWTFLDDAEPADTQPHFNTPFDDQGTKGMDIYSRLFALDVDPPLI